MIVRTDNVDAFLNAEANLQSLRDDEEEKKAESHSSEEPDPEWAEVNVEVDDFSLT